jgi:hypothetical protein
MHPIGSYIVHRTQQARHEGDWAATAEWRRLHQRPDAEPDVVAPVPPSLIHRVRAAMPRWRRHAPSGA